MGQQTGRQCSSQRYTVATFTTPVVSTTTYTLVSVTDASACVRAGGFTTGVATIQSIHLPQEVYGQRTVCATGAGQLTWQRHQGQAHIQ